MFALLKRNLFIIVIFILTISLAFITFLTFIDKSFIKLNENNLEILLISNIILVIIYFVLIFIDVMKELPLTLILKPYNLKTLAISAYAYAEDEMVAEAALPSLVLIVIVIILMFILKLDKRNE